MTKLVVTGTREGRPDVEAVLERAFTIYRYELVILGDARGVDAQAIGWAKDKAGAFWTSVKVDRKLPSPLMFHHRNQRMVDLASPGDHLLAFPDAQSRGTWDCFGRGCDGELLCVAVTRHWEAELRKRVDAYRKLATSNWYK